MKTEFTCREIYEEGLALLKDLEDGQLDARLLLEHFCKIPTHRLLADPDTPVGAKERERFLGGVRRRAEREPLAYITGEQSFMGLPFVVTPDVLIPEQDTENLVEEALRHLEDGSRILDLCTGSGCILLSLLHYSNGCLGVGTDLSPAALRVAEENARNLGLDRQAAWLQGDLFSALERTSRHPDRLREDTAEAPVASQGRHLQSKPAAGTEAEGDKKNRPFCHSYSQRKAAVKPEGDKKNRPFCHEKFDLIISNPPYIPSAVIGTLAPEVRCAEPRMALDGGPDGLDFYRRIVAQAPDHLVIGGRLMLEIGYDQAESVAGLLRDAGYYAVEILQDYGGNDRITTAVRSLRQKNV